jgi:hypothetical protein
VTKFRANPWAVLLVVSLGFFMTLLDSTILGAKTHFRKWTCQSPGPLVDQGLDLANAAARRRSPLMPP